MKMTRRILSWVLAIALVVTCGITGLVLPVAAEEVTNLFVNGDFEQGASVSWSGSALIQEGVGKDGGYGYYHVSTTTNLWSASGQVRYNGGALWGKMEAGCTYILSFDYKSNGTVVPQIYFDVSPHKQFDSSLALDGTNGEWKTMVYTFIPKEDLKPNANWEFSFRSRGGAGELWYDNFSLIKAPASLEFASETVKAEVGETVDLGVTYLNSAAADFTWASSNTDVATVENGVVTTKALGEATISATLGDVTKSVVVSVMKDKTQKWADLSKAYYTAGENKDQKVTVNTDAATGLEYFSVNGAASVRVPNFCGTVEKGQIVGLTFLVRVTDAANNAGAVRGAVQMQNIVDGYVQPEFYARSSAMDGGWERVTFYAREEYVNKFPYFEFIYLAAGTTAATPSYDVADVSVFLRNEEDVNRFGAGGDFEEGYAPVTLGNYQQGELLTKDVEIVDDPTGADNKVFHIPSAVANSGVGSYWYNAAYAYHDEEGVRQHVNFLKGKMYRISFRVYSAASVNLDSYGGWTYKGTTGLAAKSGEWRTVTAYMYHDGGDKNDVAYAFHVRFYGEAYIDDLEMYECVDATGFEIKGDAEMTLPNSQTLEVVAVPKHAFPGTLTWAVEGAGLSMSETTLKTAYVTGTTVTGGKVTVTSSLTDAEGNPLTASFDVKVNYPKNILPNGSFDTGSDAGINFDGLGTSWDYVENGGVGGSRAMKIMATGPRYMKGTTRYFRPNSVYRFALDARCDVDAVADLEVSYTAGDTKDLKVYGAGTHNNISSNWTTYYLFMVTGAAPNNTNPNYTFHLQARALGTDNAPIYIDNLRCELIESGDNMFPDSTFDTNNFQLDARTLGGAKNFPTFGYAADPADSANRVLTINNSAGASYDVMAGFAYLDAYAMYELTFDSKVNQAWKDDGSSMNFYIGEDSVENGVVTAERRGDNEFYNASTAVKQTTEWQSNKVIIFTNSKARIGSNTFHFNVSKGSASGNGILYIDNIELRRVDKGHSVHTTDSNAYMTYVSIDGTSWKQYIADVPVGSTVYVRTWGNEADRKKVLKSITARGKSGTVSILNKDVVNGYTAENFGKEGAANRSFQFVMGEGVQVKTTLQSATTNNFYMNTVGTSLRYTSDTNYDGIRFLTRLSFSEGLFKADAVEGFKLTKDGTEYTVVEIGSYLKRYSETTTGEGEAAVTTEDELTTENALWTSVAYKKGETDMKLLDYTKYYIDFTSVMLKGASVEQEDFNARKYTARGYMVLEDAEGNQITVLANSQTSASVNEIAPLVG